MNTRSTEGKQWMGQSVFSGRSAKRVGSLVCLLLSFPLFSFLIQFPFSSEMPISVKVQHLCSVTLSLFKLQDGEESTQRQTNSSRIWPEFFAWIPASQKPRKKCLAMCYVHRHGKPQSVSHSILWAPKQWAVFPSTYRHFRSLQACCDSAWLTPVSLYKLKCEIAHDSFSMGRWFFALCYHLKVTLHWVQYPISF